MKAYVYETSLDYSSSDKLLVEVRDIVRDLRRDRPELEGCSLADLAFRREHSLVNVTLYFKK